MSGTPDALRTALADRYRIERELGAGGMATVYLAHDVRHDRQVAIKVLHEDLGATLGPERFLAEIKTTAKLQHPHILPLLDSGSAGGLLYYVMPYVEGETLRSRLTRETQLPIEDAVRIAREVADALGFAHGHGIIHRDIKPENILLQGGHALVADFGIALAVQQAGGTRLTQTGLSLGTPQYMSPEQAMGEKTVGPAADLYALGAVTYEMLTGDPPFTGSSVQAIVAKVLSDRPTPPSMVRDTIPPNVESAVLKALAKLPADRFATATEFAAVIADASRTLGAAPSRAPATGTRHRHVPLVAAGAVALAMMAAGYSLARRSTGRSVTAPPPARLKVKLDSGQVHSIATWRIALSPDGQRLAYASVTGAILTRSIEERVFNTVRGIGGATTVAFSPDGDSLVFWQTAGDLSGHYVVAVGGGAPRRIPITQVSSSSWGIQSVGGRMMVGLVDGTWAVIGANGSSTVLARPDQASGERAIVGVGSLGDGRVLAIAIGNANDARHLDVVSVDGSIRTTLIDRPIGFAAYADGMLLTVAPSGEMAAMAFDPRSLRMGSEVVLDTVASTMLQLPIIAADTTGTVAFAQGPLKTDLVLVDRAGKSQLLVGSREFHRPRISPDGRRVLVDISERGFRDVWMFSLSNPLPDRVTFSGSGHDPTWLAAGDGFIYLVNMENDQVGPVRHRFAKPSAGDTIALATGQVQVHDVIPARGTALAVTAPPGSTSNDLAEVALDESRRVTPIAPSPANETHPAMSPDGRWIAYCSDESGRNEVYLRPYGREGARVRVSDAGGTEPVWRRDGRALFYRNANPRAPAMVETILELGAEPRVVSRTDLFPLAEFATATPHPNYDVLPDGRFLMVRQPPIRELTVIQNWPELTRRLLKAAGKQ